MFTTPFKRQEIKRASTAFGVQLDGWTLAPEIPDKFSNAGCGADEGGNGCPKRVERKRQAGKIGRRHGSGVKKSSHSNPRLLSLFLSAVAT